MVANGDSGRPGESATENTPPERARVKRRGKSSPPRWRHRGQGKPHPEQGQTSPHGMARPGAGRPLEPAGNRGSRQITAPAARREQNSAYVPLLLFYFMGSGLDLTPFFLANVLRANFLCSDADPPSRISSFGMKVLPPGITAGSSICRENRNCYPSSYLRETISFFIYQAD